MKTRSGMTALYIYRKRRTVRVFFVLIFMLLSIFVFSSLEIETNFDQFLKDRNAAEILKQDDLFLVLRCRDEKNSEMLYELKLNIEDALRSNEAIYSLNLENEEYSIEKIESFFKKYFYLFMEISESQSLSEALSDSGSIQRRLERFYERSASFGNISLFQDDLLNIYNDIAENLDFYSMAQESPGYESRDGRALLIMIRTDFPPQDIARNTAFIEQLKDTIALTASDMGIEISQGQFYDIETPGTEYAYLMAGGHIFSYYDSRTIRLDIIMSLTFTAIFLSLLFYFSFRGFGSLLALISLLSLGLLMTYTTAIILYGPVNIFVAAFSAVLLALGIDYLIHLYSTDLDQEFRTREERLINTYNKAFSGILFGSITTAFCFYALYMIDFPLIRQLAVIIGTGILIMFTIIILLYPVFASGHKKPARIKLAKTMFLMLMKKRKAVVAISLLIQLMMGIWILGNRRFLSFDPNFSNLRPRLDIPGNNLKYVYSSFDMSANTLFCMFNPGNNMPQDIREGIAFLKENRNRYNFTFPDIGFIFRDKTELSMIKASLDRINFPLLRQEIHISIDRFQLDEDYVSDYTLKLENSLNHNFISDYRKLLEKKDFRDIFKRLIIFDEDNRLSLVLLPLNFNTPLDAEKFLLETQRPGSMNILDINSIIRDIQAIVKGSFPYAVLLALLATIIIVMIKFRNIYAVFSLIPTSFSLLTVLFVMTVLKIHFNYSSIIVLPIIFGIGIDDGIHFMHRYTLSGNTLESFSGVFFPVIMTSVTTIIGFGSLMFSSYTGLVHIGLLSSAGILSSLVYSLFILPAFVDNFLNNTKGGK